jgi:hypothetical protein
MKDYEAAKVDARKIECVYGGRTQEQALIISATDGGGSAWRPKTPPPPPRPPKQQNAIDFRWEKPGDISADRWSQWPDY